MNNSEFKFIVNRKPYTDSWEIHLIERNGIKLYIYNVGKYGNLIATEITESEQIHGTKDRSPLMVINGMLWEQLVRAISEDLPNVKRDEIDAELKATKYHLEDMRSLVFKKRKDEK